MSAPATLLVVGPPTHGVTLLARTLARQGALADLPVVRVDDGVTADWAQVAPRLGTGLTHVHVTDRLFGRDAPHAAERLAELAATTRLAVTFHDLPQPSDGPGAYERRTRAYAAIARLAETVVVNSEHERLLWAEALDAHPSPGAPDAADLLVVPLPLEAPSEQVRPAELQVEPSREVAVMGFLYPGKGHEEALDAVLTLPADVGLAALGRPSPGHEDLADDLGRRARHAGRAFRMTGYLEDDDLRRELRAAAVPVAPHRHISASGSIGSWIAAGRRPIVPRGRYVDELEARCPGLLLRYEGVPGALAATCREALENPRRTLLPPGAHVGPDTAEVARRYARLLSGRPWRRHAPPVEGRAAGGVE